MDRSKSSNSKNTKRKGYKANFAKKSPSGSIRIQKSNQSSIFDFSDPDDDEFDVKPVRKNIRRRNKLIEADAEHQILVNCTKKERASKSRKLARNPKSLYVETIASDKKLFTTCVDDNRKCEENMSSSSKNKLLISSFGNDAYEERAETENEDLRSSSVLEKSPRQSLIDQSIEKMEKLETKKKDQDSDFGRSKEEDECMISEKTPMLLVASQSTKSQKFCPICHIVFASSETDNEITIHVNACLDLPNRNENNSELTINNTSPADEPGSAVSEDRIKMDEDFARELQERENAKEIEEKLSSDLFFCGICQKDLNRLSAASRQVHINKCADFCEKESTAMRRAQRKSLMEACKEFECLICGEKFSSNLQKVSHMKKCCKESNVDRRELLQLVREVSTSDLTLNTVQKSEDQLSIPARTVNDLVLSSAVHSKSDAKRKRKNRRKKLSNEEVPILLTRSEEEAQKIALSKAGKMIEEMTNLQLITEKRDTICLPESKLANKYKRIIEMTSKREVEKNNESLKTTSSKVGDETCAHSLWEFSDIRTSLLETTKFYVPDVFGEDLERTSQRLKHNEKSVAVNVQDHSKQDDSMNGMHLLSTSVNENVDFDDNSKISTDAVTSRVEHSDFAEQNDKITVYKETGTTCNITHGHPGTRDEACSKVGFNGFLENDLNENRSSELKQELDRFACKAKESLLLNMESLLNDEETKDVKLLCADGEVHRAHSCILRARCPKLREAAKVLDFTRYSETAVAAVLRYIYIGEINHEMKDPEDVYELADWLSLELLAEACTVILDEHRAREDHIDIDENFEKSNIEDLEKTLWHPDVEEEAESAQKGMSDIDSPFDEGDEEDLRCFIATQRERRSSTENCDDGTSTQFRSKDIGIDRILCDDSAEDEECYLLDAEDSCTTSTVVNHETDIESCQNVMTSGIRVPLGSDKDAQNQRVEKIKVSSLSWSSDIVCDEDHTTSMDVHLECLHKEDAKFIDCEVKEGSAIHTQGVDGIKKMRYSPDKPVESGSDCDRSSSDNADRSLHTHEAATAVTGAHENIGNHKKPVSELKSRGCVKLSQPNSSAECDDGGHPTTELHIVDLRSPDMKFDSDEEHLFDSFDSGGLDTAICLDESEDDGSQAESQANDLEDESDSLELNAGPVSKTPENGTGLPECGYDSSRNGNRCDISDSNTDLCDSDSVELQRDSKPALNCKEPVSPCVTISQFERKCDSENSDQVNGNTARALPSINQKTVINLDEEESGEEERGCMTNHPGGSGDTIIGNTLRRGLSNLYERGVNEKSLYQHDNARTKGDRASNFVSSTEGAIPAIDTGLVLHSSSDEEQPQELVNEGGGSSCLQDKPCSKQSCLKKDVAFTATERLGKGKQSLHRYIEITEMPPEMMALGKAGPLDDDNGSSDEVIDVTPNFDVDSPEIVQIGKTYSTPVVNQSDDDDHVRTQFCKSSSPVIPRLSPEFLPPSYGRKVRCTLHRSPGSLKRKTLFGSGSLSHCSGCTDKELIDGKTEYNHPSKKMKLASSIIEASPLRTSYSNLESKSPSMHNSGSQSSSDAEKAFSNRSRCSEEKSPQSSYRRDSRRIQDVEGVDNFCKVQNSSSYLDCFDDGGFNPDINYDNLISSNCSFTEADNFESRMKENDEESDQEKEHKPGDNVIEINSETDMLDFSDDGGFSSDAMHCTSISIKASDVTKRSSGTSVEAEKSKRSTMRANRIGPGRIDLCESARYDPLPRNIENSDRCNSDSLLTADKVWRGASKSKAAVEKRSKQQRHQEIASNKSPAAFSLTATQTPCNVVKAFGPGCSVHPETGATITPMSDYDSLQTPILAKRVKQYGLRKLPKHQMAGKMREIYKLQHGFTDWEEPPTKPKRKTKGKHTSPKKIARAGDEKSANESSASSTSSDDEGQQTFEGCYSDDELCSQACSQSDQTDETLSEKLLKFFRDRKELYEKILMYQKLNFDEIYDLVKEAKIKCSKSRLTDFLDEQCICFVVPKADDKPRARRRKKT